MKCTCGAVFALAEAARLDVDGPLPPLELIVLEEADVPVRAASPTPAVVAAPRGLRPETASTGIRLKPLEPAAAISAVAAPSAPVAVRAPRPAPPAPSSSAAAAPRPAPTAGWKRCRDHADRTSDYVCGNCVVGFCGACVQDVKGAGICPACDGLCVRASRYEAGLAVEAQRGRSLFADLPTILGYPFQDPVAYVMLAVFTWFFALAGRMALFGGPAGILLSQGVLMAYCFYALSRVSDGNLKEFMPDLSDIGELIRPLRLGAAALLVSWAPLLLVLFLGPGLSLAEVFFAAGPEPTTAVVRADAPAQPPGDEAADAVEEVLAEGKVPGGEEARPVSWADLSVGMLLLILPAVLWKLIYTPVALTVAGLSRSVLSTLNPVIGIGTILNMGSTYWQAMGIYTVIAVVQGIVGFVLSFIPLAGSFLASFVNAYAYLAIGCTLGLAVFKKARELGFD